MQGVCCYQVRRPNRKLLALKHPQHRKQRFGSLNRAMEDETCGGFSENRPFLSISLLPPSFRPPWFLIRPGLPALQPTVPAAESFVKHQLGCEPSLPCIWARVAGEGTSSQALDNLASGHFLSCCKNLPPIDWLPASPMGKSQQG